MEVSCWKEEEEEEEEDEQKEEHDRGGVLNLKWADRLVRGGGGGNNRGIIVSFMLDVECAKIAADKAEEEVDESDESE